MTNQEIDQIVFRIERKTLLRSMLTTQIPGFAFVAFLTLGVLGVVLEQSFTAFAVLIVPVIIFMLSLGMTVQSHNRHKRARFWNCVRKSGFAGDEPTADTKLLIEKIVEIQTATPGNELLTLRQSVKLATVYERQSRQLEAVKARLAKLKSTHQTLSQKIQQLQALGENHAAGLQGLAQTRAEFESLQKLAQAMQSSCDRLEAILNAVTKTARTRQLHHELDQLSAPVTAATPPGEPAFAHESLEEIERQIGREIETYLQLERETEEHLR